MTFFCSYKNQTFDGITENTDEKTPYTKPQKKKKTKPRSFFDSKKNIKEPKGKTEDIKLLKT